MKHLEELGKVLDEDNYDWLNREAPAIATAIENEVKRGATPEQIERFMIAHMRSERTAFVARAVSAARHLRTKVQ